jgi:hypothetical protein
MINRDEFAGKGQKEIELMCESDIQTFVLEVNELSTQEEILNLEKEIEKAMDENDARLKATEYDVPESCTFNDMIYDAKTAASYIVSFINTQEVDWNYTLGLYELVKLWKDRNLKTIKYHAYDSTLRILGQCKYKGFENWKRILVVNTFLGSCHEEYVRDTAYLIYLSSLHNVLLDALKKFETPADTPEDSGDKLAVQVVE